jgi:hypothetical protein
MQNWPNHRPGTTLHHIVLDGIARDLPNKQIIAETNNIADTEMIDFYRLFCILSYYLIRLYG